MKKEKEMECDNKWMIYTFIKTAPQLTTLDPSFGRG
jgi:hypothetical protein